MQKLETRPNRVGLNGTSDIDKESSIEKLKNHLTPIRAYTDLLYQGKFGKLSDSQRQKIELINEQTKKITSYLETIKNEGFSQLEPAKVNDQTHGLELNTLTSKLKERITQATLLKKEKYSDFTKDQTQELKLNVLRSELKEKLTQATLLKAERDSDSIRVEKSHMQYDIDAISREITKIQKKSMKILIVNSNESLCKMLETYLIRKGHDCLCAIDGRNGLSLIENEKFDVVLLGLTMPNFNGYDVIDALEKSEKLKKNKIIIFTAVHLSQSEIEDLLKRGVYSYVRQPVKLDVLLRILKTI